MLDWIQNTSLSIALSLEKKGKLNLGTSNRRPRSTLKTSYEGPSRGVLTFFTKICHREIYLRRSWDVRLGRY